MVFVSYFLVSEQISFFLEYFYFLPFFYNSSSFICKVKYLHIEMASFSHYFV